MDHPLLELLAEEKVRELARVDPHRVEALELASRSSGLRGAAAAALLRVATVLDRNVVRAAAAR